MWLAQGTTSFSLCSSVLTIYHTFLKHSVLRTILCSKMNTQHIIQGFCFYLEDKAKKLTSWLQDTHSSRVVNGGCRNLASLKSQAVSVRKKCTASRSWPTGKLEAWIRKELNILVLTACKQEIDNSGISRLLPKSSVPKTYMIFCSLFHPVRGEGIAEIANMGQLPKENEDCFVREYSARLRNN